MVKKRNILANVSGRSIRFGFCHQPGVNGHRYGPKYKERIRCLGTQRQNKRRIAELSWMKSQHRLWISQITKLRGGGRIEMHKDATVCISYLF